MDRARAQLSTVTPWQIGVVVLVVVLAHLAGLAWLNRQELPEEEDFEPAEVTVELVASQSLAVPTDAPAPEVVDEPIEDAPEPEAKPEPERMPEPEAASKSASKPAPASEAESDTEPKSKSKPEPQPKPKPKPKPEPTPVPESQSGADPAPKPQPKPESAPASSTGTAATEDAEGLDNPPPPYPRRAYFDRLTGTVHLRLRVDTNGRVADLEIAESSGHSILDDAAASSVIDWRFKPAHRDGRPVAQWVEVPITFQLE